MATDFFALAKDLAFDRAANVRRTHTQEWDPRGSAYASCGARVHAADVVTHGARPTCPACAALLDEDQQTLVVLRLVP